MGSSTWADRYVHACLRRAAFVVLRTSVPPLDLYATTESTAPATQYVLWISCDGKSYRQNIGFADGYGCTLDGRVSFVDPFELVHYYRHVPYCVDHTRGQIVERYAFFLLGCMYVNSFYPTCVCVVCGVDVWIVLVFCTRMEVTCMCRLFVFYVYWCSKCCTCIPYTFVTFVLHFIWKLLSFFMCVQVA